MGFLMSKLWEMMYKLPEFKILIVGLDNAGKTTTLYKLFLDEVVFTNPTLGANVEEIQYKNMKFLMWDLGGQETSRATWVNYYNGTTVIIFVIDSTDRERLSISKKELHQMLNCEALAGCKLLVMANKNDMKGAMTAAEVSEYLGLEKIRDHNWHIQSCCALTGDGLPEGVEWIYKNVSA